MDHYNSNKLQDDAYRGQIQHELADREFEFTVMPPKNSGQAYGFAQNPQFTRGVFFFAADVAALADGYRGGETFRAKVQVNYNKKQQCWDFAIASDNAGERPAQSAQSARPTPLPAHVMQYVGRSVQGRIVRPSAAADAHAYAFCPDINQDVFFWKNRLLPAVNQLFEGDCLVGVLALDQKKGFSRINLGKAELLPWGGLWQNLLCNLRYSRQTGISLSSKLLAQIEQLAPGTAGMLDGWLLEPEEVDIVAELEKFFLPDGNLSKSAALRKRLDHAGRHNARFEALCRLLSSFEKFIAEHGGGICDPAQRRQSSPTAPAAETAPDNAAATLVEAVTPSDATSVYATVLTLGKGDNRQWLFAGIAAVNSVVNDLSRFKVFAQASDMHAALVPFILHLGPEPKSETCFDSWQTAWPVALRLIIGQLLPADAAKKLDLYLDLPPNLNIAAQSAIHNGYFAAWAAAGNPTAAQWQLRSFTAAAEHAVVRSLKAQLKAEAAEKLYRLRCYVALTADLQHDCTNLVAVAGHVDFDRLFRLIPRLAGSCLWPALIQQGQAVFAGSAALQADFINALEACYEAKQRDLPRLQQLLRFAAATMAPPPPQRLRQSLLWALIAIQNANHRGEPEKAVAQVELYFQLRTPALELDRELVVYADLNLAVHFADQFQFERAAQVIQMLLDDPHFDAVSLAGRARVISACGQYMAMRNRHAEAEARFAEALQMFERSAEEPQKRYDEIDQTAVYRAINAVDAGFANARELVEQVLGPLDAAVPRLAADNSIGSYYHHHLLVRALVLMPELEPRLKQLYIAEFSRWSWATQHPWPLIGMYRALLLLDANSGNKAHEAFRTALAAIDMNNCGSTMALIGGMIAAVAYMQIDWAQADCIARQLLARARQQLPAAAAAADVLTAALENPAAAKTPSLLAQLPFNYH